MIFNENYILIYTQLGTSCHTHLIGPSFAYSSWILFSDIISLLVLRFLLSEHVSLKLNTEQQHQLKLHRTAPNTHSWKDYRQSVMIRCKHSQPR